ncbi:MAG: response regulator transcription factor, partial [Myxococcota bacterium]
MGTVIVADDHPLFREAMKVALKPFELDIAECATLDDCHATLELNPEVDLVLLDLNMPGSLGLYGLVSLRNTFPSVPVAIISGSDKPEMIAKAMGLGALGFIPKSTAPDRMRSAVQQILEGEPWFPDIGDVATSASNHDSELTDRVSRLTPQQYTVLGAMREGKLNKEIADELGISEATVKAHVSAVFKKLEVSNRTQAVVLAS